MLQSLYIQDHVVAFEREGDGKGEEDINGINKKM